MKLAGIYAIVNARNDRRYIGQSADVTWRMRVHRSRLRRGKHPNAHLQNAWNKYGDGAFHFVILLRCSSSDLTFFEERVARLYRDRLGGVYNVGEFVDNPFRGQRHSADSRRRMSDTRRERYPHQVPNFKRKPGEVWLGRKHREESIEKIRAAATNPSPETREKLRAAKLGKPGSVRTPEQMAHHVDGALRMWERPEYRAKQAAARDRRRGAK